jgi:MFS transporter, CP family, cyanate transporter
VRKADAGLEGVNYPVGTVLANSGVLLIGGILVVSFNMRAAITSLPPVFPELRHAAGLSNAALAALAAVPVLSFAIFSWLAPVLARRIGEERVIILALGLLVAGLGLRSAAPGLLLFPGTILAAGAIALVNVLLPSLVKRRKPELAGLLIGLYLMSLTAGAVLAAVIAVPVFNAAGSAAVRLTLGMWAAPALIAIIVWLPQVRFRTRPDIKPGDERRGAGPGGRPPGTPRGVLEMTRHKLAWQVRGFMGLQSLAYYATLSWFPTMFRDHGISATAAGNLLALMNLGNAISGLFVPMLAQRARDQRKLVVVAVMLIAVGLAGCGFGPNSTVIGFVSLLGLGQGASFGLSVFLFTARAADSHSAAALSGFAQGGGYLIAAAGPLLVGIVHTATGSWTIPILGLLGVVVGQLATGLLAARAKTIGTPATAPLPQGVLPNP